jgi:hypothetical protein
MTCPDLLSLKPFGQCVFLFISCNPQEWAVACEQRKVIRDAVLQLLGR